MPIYEYRCQDCSHELEKLQKMSDPLLTDCPACGKASLRKLVSAAGFRLKGGGWYETDFKKSGKRNVASSSSDSGDGGKDSGSGGGSSDSSGTGSSDSSGKDSGSSEKSGSKAGSGGSGEKVA